MRTDIEFSSGGDTLRGWLYRPENTQGEVPLVIMTHGFAGIKEWVAPFAEEFARSGLACLVYDHPCFGSSDGTPRQDVDPNRQIEGYRDAITMSETLEGIDANRIGIWGTSYSGGHVLVVAATDRRVKAVVSQVPLTQGWANLTRLIPSVAMPMVREAIAQDRRDRYAGKPPTLIKSSSADPAELVAMPGLEVHEWLQKNGPQHPTWSDDVTVSSVDKFQTYAPEAFVTRVSPTPLLFVIGAHDTLTPSDLSIQSFAEAREPKQLELIPGGHFSVYEDQFERASSVAAKFLSENL